MPDASTNHAEIMKRYFDAWQRGDADAAMSLWAEDIVHHVPGRHRLAGDFAGKQAFLKHYGRVFEDLGGTIEVTGVHDVLTSNKHAVALVHERAVRGDRTLDFNRVVVYHARDGKIVETWSYDYDTYALDEFWA